LDLALNRDKPSVGGIELTRKHRGDVEGDGRISSKNRRRVGDIELRLLQSPHVCRAITNAIKAERDLSRDQALRRAQIFARLRMMMTRQLRSLAAVGFFLAIIIGEVRQDATGSLGFAQVGSLERVMQPTGRRTAGCLSIGVESRATPTGELPPSGDFKNRAACYHFAYFKSRPAAGRDLFICAGRVRRNLRIRTCSRRALH
jgi:hypothetical protein